MTTSTKDNVLKVPYWTPFQMFIFILQSCVINYPKTTDLETNKQKTHPALCLLPENTLSFSYVLKLHCTFQMSGGGKVAASGRADFTKWVF